MMIIVLNNSNDYEHDDSNCNFNIFLPQPDHFDLNYSILDNNDDHDNTISMIVVLKFNIMTRMRMMMAIDRYRLL